MRVCPLKSLQSETLHVGGHGQIEFRPCPHWSVRGIDDKHAIDVQIPDGTSMLYLVRSLVYEEDVWEVFPSRTPLPCQCQSGSTADAIL